MRGQSDLGLSGRQTRSVKGVRQLNSANPTKPPATPILRSLFCRKIASECAAAALGVFAVLFGIIVTAHFVRLLNRAASGGFAPDAVIAAMSFQSLNLLPVIIALTIFVAALITLTRNYRDSEMVVWFACGVPLRTFVVPLLRFALPFVLLIAVLSLLVRPWAVTRSQQMEAELASRDEITAIAPGVFKETRGGEKIYFVESFSNFNQTLSEVFIRSLEGDQVAITVAHSGHIERAANGDRFLVLTDGRRYEGAPGSARYRVTRFESSDLLVQPYEKQAQGGSAKSRSTAELWTSERLADLAELQWRLHLPLAALMLVLLAVPLGFVNPRANRSVNLLLAVLIYAVYSNALSITNSWVAQGRLAPLPGFLSVHLALLLVIGVLLAWQTNRLRLSRGAA